MNRYQIIGNLGNDATVRTLDSGTNAISFNVAVTKKWTDKQGQKQESTTWVSCTQWKLKDQSTAVAQYLKKGTRVLVEGEPSARSYTDNSGAAKASLDMRVDNIELLSQANTNGAAPVTNQAQPVQAVPMDNQDLPF